MGRKDNINRHSSHFALCSQLVELCSSVESGEQTVTVNLEAIRARDAVLLSEVVIPKTSRAAFAIGSIRLNGSVVSCVRDGDLGFRVRLHFAKSSRWTPALVEPKHMLDLSAIREIPEPVNLIAANAPPSKAFTASS